MMQDGCKERDELIELRQLNFKLAPSKSLEFLKLAPKKRCNKDAEIEKSCCYLELSIHKKWDFIEAIRFRNKHSNGLVIEEIVQEVGLNEDVKEDLGNKGKQETNDDASISGLEGDFLTWVNDDFLDQANEVEWQHYSYYALEDDEEIAGMFAELHQAYKENVVSHLDEPVVFEEVWDMGLFD
nr:hypothetical protein [Tanacetum cinerariifolium]